MSPAHEHLFRVLTREENLFGVAVTAVHMTSANVTTTFWAPFRCSLFNDTDGNSGYTASNEWMVVNNELEKTSKEAIMA
jgi:hypothetical protein